MRVISGTARGRRLSTFKGRNIRPTSDRVREALFSILQSRIGSFSGAAVLDLFSGSGALAIEALSRGAEVAYLVEKAQSSVQVIRDNLTLCKFSDRAHLVVNDAVKALGTFKPQSFDIIFLDPPYGQGLANKALQEIERLQLLKEDGVVCAETGANECLEGPFDTLKQIDQRRYGSIMVSLYGF